MKFMISKSIIQATNLYSTIQIILEIVPGITFQTYLTTFYKDMNNSRIKYSYLPDKQYYDNLAEILSNDTSAQKLM